MELLDRYLQAVSKYLPWKRQADIIAELRANLESQLDEQQAELGRTMTSTEAEAWIRQLGSPVHMAAHYQPQQYLIGPAVFPVYKYVLRLACAWAAVVYLLVSAINLVVGSATVQPAALGSALLNLPFVLIQVAAWVTLIFAAIEFTAAHFPEKCPSIAGFHAKWSPSDLPPLERRTLSGGTRRSYALALTEAAFGFLVLGWLLLVPQNPYLMFGPGVAFLHASPYLLAPIWMTVYWWIVALNAVQLGWRCLDLLRGSWQRPSQYQHVIVKTMGLVPLVIAANVHDRMYILLKRPDVDLQAYGATLNQTNQGIHSAMLILCVIVSAQLAWAIAQAILDIARNRAASK